MDRRAPGSLAVSGAIPDIVASGYDAGLEFGEVIDRAIAVPVRGKMRLAVVGSPSYFASHAIPRIRVISPSTSASTGMRRPMRQYTAGSSPRDDRRGVSADPADVGHRCTG